MVLFLLWPWGALSCLRRASWGCKQNSLLFSIHKVSCTRGNLSAASVLHQLGAVSVCSYWIQANKTERWLDTNKSLTTSSSAFFSRVLNFKNIAYALLLFIYLCPPLVEMAQVEPWIKQWLMHPPALFALGLLPWLCLSPLPGGCGFPGLAVHSMEGWRSTPEFTNRLLTLWNTAKECIWPTGLSNMHPVPRGGEGSSQR